MWACEFDGLFSRIALLWRSLDPYFNLRLFSTWSVLLSPLCLFCGLTGGKRRLSAQHNILGKHAKALS